MGVNWLDLLVIYKFPSRLSLDVCAIYLSFKLRDRRQISGAARIQLNISSRLLLSPSSSSLAINRLWCSAVYQLLLQGPILQKSRCRVAVIYFDKTSNSFEMLSSRDSTRHPQADQSSEPGLKRCTRHLVRDRGGQNWSTTGSGQF